MTTPFSHTLPQQRPGSLTLKNKQARPMRFIMMQIAKSDEVFRSIWPTVGMVDAMMSFEKTVILRRKTVRPTAAAPTT